MAVAGRDAAQALRERIEKRTARVGIVGLGYVGLPLALLFSEERFPVTGFDIDEAKVETLNSSGSYIVRIPPTEIARAQANGFTATSDYDRLREMDAVLICVPTPLNEYHEPDLSYITNTVEAIAPRLRAGQLIVLESTTYPGTTEEIVVPLLERGNRDGMRVVRAGEPGGDVYVAFSPEREDPGNDTVARRDIPKVVGGVDPVATKLGAALYGSIFNRTVEVNELKQLCARMGIDIFEVIDAAKTKPFGFQPFYPGPGLGGHCIPIDPFYLSWKAKQFDFRTRFIELAGEINGRMPYYVVDETAAALNEQRKPLKGSRVLVLGMAYKRDIDDLRESPSLTIIELLQSRGALVDYNDPFFPKVGRGRHYDLHMESVPLDTIGKYDCVMIVTDHSSYDYPAIVRDAQLVVDTRNATRGIDSPKIVRC
jgi:UDP-N-acetyl-D-glucosamine dehydrogenase